MSLTTFRYEAIKKGQKFQGIIVVDDETADLEKLRGMLEGQIFYFGGSREVDMEGALWKMLRYTISM